MEQKKKSEKSVWKRSRKDRYRRAEATEIRLSMQPIQHTGNSVSPKGPDAAVCCSSRTD